MYMYKEVLAEITYNDWYGIQPNQTESYIFDIYMKRGFGLNNLQWFICHKTQSKPMRIPLQNAFW